MRTILTATSAALRTAMRAMNVGGRALTGLGFQPVTLDEHSILDEACHQTGLDDFGGDEFREPLRLLLYTYETEARLTLLGRIAARADTISLLANRLRLVEDCRRHPGIAEQSIRRPLFIVGLPRTGSTMLHHLLAQDPASRTAQAWEVMTPSPPPERQRYETDVRIAHAHRELRWLDRLAPGFKAIHPLGAQVPLECLAITSYSFLSQRFHTMYRVPTYQEWLLGQDVRPAYALHRRFLQHLQWRTPAERWVLKAPSHIFAFDALYEAYPDALIVQTHRDPVTVLASVASLTAVLRSAFSDHVDLAEIGLEVTRHWADGLERAALVRRRGQIPAERFLDLNYRDLVNDPLAAVRRIYAQFDLPLTAATGERMRRYLAGHPQHHGGRHVYSLASFGLDQDHLTHRFKAYNQHIASQPEHVLERGRRLREVGAHA
jgi:hypothetical protein